MELKFEDIVMQKWNIPTDRAQRVYEKNRTFFCLSCLLPWNYGHENVKNCSSFVLSVDYSKVSVTVWAKYLDEFERFYLVLSENAMDC